MAKTTKELKCDLYRALLDIDVAKLTDNEIDLSFLLAQDEEVQEVLREAAENEEDN